MRLNLGCGHNKLSGWLNVDKSPGCSPDQVLDLERLPWPWPDNSAEEVMLSHALEHLGADFTTYIGVMKEMWRVCRPSAKVTIVVPHPRHDDFLTDPTHVRAITGPGLEMLSRKANEAWLRSGSAHTTLALYHGIDFEIVSAHMVLDDPWGVDLEAGRIDQATVAQAARQLNNVIKEQRFVLRAVK